MATPRKLPTCLHHTAYTTKDMEQTRVFHIPPYYVVDQ